MLCINCKQTKLPADSHVLCVRCCGCSQLSPCARSASWASEIWEELSHFPSYVSSGREQAQGFPSSTLVNNFQLNSGPAPDLENRRRGPQVAVTVTGNECLTRGPRPAPSDASRRKATQGALANPCSGGNSEPRYLPGYRTPYRYVNSAAFNTAGRFPSNVTVPSSQFSWQEGADQGAFYWPYFYPWGSWGGFSGYDYYPNLYLPCPEAIPSSSSSITKTVSQENGSLPLVAGIRTTPNIQVTGSVSHTTPAVSSFRNPKPIQSGMAKVSLSTVPTISKASQHNNTRAIPTCSGIIFQEGSFSDSLIAEPVIGTTNLGRSRNSKNRLGTSSTSSALPSVRVSHNVNEAFGHLYTEVQNSSRVPLADYSYVGALGSVEDDVPIGPSVSAVRPSVTIPALSRDSSLGLTATPLRVTNPSRSTPDIASAISQAVLRTLSGLGNLASSVDLPSVAEEGEGQTFTGQSGSTGNGRDHVRTISQDPRAPYHECDYVPDQALSESSLSPSQKSQSHEPATNYHETLEEVYSLLGDLCPKADQTQDSARVQSLLESILDQPTSSRSTLPQSSTVNQLMGKLFDNTAEARNNPNWHVPKKTIDYLTRPHSYACHTEFWPSKIPTLDADAGRLGISVGRFASLPVAHLEYLERLARRAVAISSHCDFFGSAAFQALCAEHVDPDVLRSLLLAVNRSAKHIMALGLSMSAVLLHQRRNAALNTSNLLLSHNKDSLRAAPLNSSSLFGGKIEEVFRANLDDRHHSLLRANYSGVSANRKRPSSSSFNSNPAKKSRWEPKASRVPTSTSSSAVSFNRFRSTRGGRGGSSSFRRGPARRSK